MDYCNTIFSMPVKVKYKTCILSVMGKLYGHTTTLLVREKLATLLCFRMDYSGKCKLW